MLQYNSKWRNLTHMEIAAAVGGWSADNADAMCTDLVKAEGGAPSLNLHEVGSQLGWTVISEHFSDGPYCVMKREFGSVYQYAYYSSGGSSS